MPRKKKPPITAQQPKPGPISFQDIQWVPKTRKGFGKMITIMAAYLPFNRVEDFMVGQTCPDGSVGEWIVADRARGVQVGRPQIDSYIEHVHYECAFGPQDHTGDPQHPRSKKRGCIAKFSIKQLLLFPDVVEVAYYHVDHTKVDGSLAHGGIKAILELSVPRDPLEDGHAYDCGDSINNKDTTEVKEKDMEGAAIISGNIDRTSIQPLSQTQPSIEECLLAIEKLQEDVRQEARGGGLLLVQQLQAMMTKTLNDVKRIRGQIETGNLRSQYVFEVVDDSLGNSIVMKKKFRKQTMLAMSSQRKRNRSALDE